MVDTPKTMATTLAVQMLASMALLTVPVLAPAAAGDVGVPPAYVGLYIALAYGASDVQPCSRAVRKPASWDGSNWPGRPTAISRSASMPPSSKRAFHVYAVCSATPTARAASAGFLPASIMRPARRRLRVASSILAMPAFSNQLPDRIMHDGQKGCHELIASLR